MYDEEDAVFKAYGETQCKKENRTRLRGKTYPNIQSLMTAVAVFSTLFWLEFRTAGSTFHVETVGMTFLVVIKKWVRKWSASIHLIKSRCRLISIKRRLICRHTSYAISLNSCTSDRQTDYRAQSVRKVRLVAVIARWSETGLLLIRGSLSEPLLTIDWLGVQS